MVFFKDLLLKVKAFVFDVDGVLANPKIIIDHAGNLLRTSNTKDGFALRTAILKGYPIGLITGGTFEQIKNRYEFMGVNKVYLGSTNKVDDLLSFINEVNIFKENILFMGDDLPDLEAMKMIGIPVCPSDAATEIKNISKYISDKKGGEGCVRDVVEQVLRAQNNWT